MQSTGGCSYPSLGLLQPCPIGRSSGGNSRTRPPDHPSWHEVSSPVGHAFFSGIPFRGGDAGLEHPFHAPLPRVPLILPLFVFSLSFPSSLNLLNLALAVYCTQSWNPTRRVFLRLLQALRPTAGT